MVSPMINSNIAVSQLARTPRQNSRRLNAIGNAAVRTGVNSEYFETAVVLSGSASTSSTYRTIVVLSTRLDAPG